jgi:predicted lipoprotein with Yx(FWY)xxD motif
MKTIEGSFMPRTQRARLGRRAVAAILAGAVGVGAALLVSIAVARAFTLQVARNARVVNPMTGVVKHESIAVWSKTGHAVYTLTGDTTGHLECTSALCLSIWPPVRVPSTKVSKAPGIPGKLGTFKRKGFRQLTLNGHPLYEFSGDSQKAAANGEGIMSFGGTWHVTKATTTKGSQQPATTMSTSTGTTTSPYGY